MGLAAHSGIVACNHASHLVVPVAALVAAAHVVNAQDIVADDVPHVDGRHLGGGGGDAGAGAEEGLVSGGHVRHSCYCGALPTTNADTPALMFGALGVYQLSCSRVPHKEGSNGGGNQRFIAATAAGDSANSRGTRGRPSWRTRW